MLCFTNTMFLFYITFLQAETFGNSFVMENFLDAEQLEKITQAVSISKICLSHNLWYGRGETENTHLYNKDANQAYQNFFCLFMNKIKTADIKWLKLAWQQYLKRFATDFQLICHIKICDLCMKLVNKLLILIT